jgi:LuxS protein involved in autoinducer AI2 synthesis
MDRIASFTVDHNVLVPGLYLSRRDGSVVTFDLRFKRPNTGDLLTNAQLHSTEHLIAPLLRNSPEKDAVLYFGPMGCRTGFYLLLRDSVPPKEAIGLVRDSMAFIAGFEGHIPGASRKECGNYRSHDLPGARRTAAAMLEALEGWTPEMLSYAAGA